MLAIACKSNKSSATATEANNQETVKESAEVIAPKEQEESIPNEVVKVVPEESAADDASIFGKWQIALISEGENKFDIPYEDWAMQLSFIEEQEDVSVKTPCNSGGCGYNVDGNKISFMNNCFMTEMYCSEEERNEWERKLVEILQTITDVNYPSGSDLLLKGPKYSIELIKM